MEAKVLFALFVCGLLAFTAAHDGDSNGSDSGSDSLGSYGDSFEQKDDDCDRLVEGSDDNDGKCELTDGLEELPEEVECTPEEKTIWLDWIVILKGVLKIKASVEERLTKALAAIQKFQLEHPKVYELFQFQNVSGWGLLGQFQTVVQYRQRSKVEWMITLDDEDNCPLFDALFNCTDGSLEQELAIHAFINETLIDICGNYSLSVKERSVLIYKELNKFFAINAEWQFSFFQYYIVGFGSFQQFFEVCRTEWQITQVDVIFEGSVEECQFMVSFESQINILLEDAEISLTIKGVLKEFLKVCKQELGKCTKGKCRMSLFIKLLRQYMKLYNVKIWEKILNIQISGFGSIFALLECGPGRVGTAPEPTIASTSFKPTCGCTCAPVSTALP